MDNETCHELKSIEYKSNLLNRNSSRRLSSASNTNSRKIGTLQNMEDFLEQEKTFHKDTPWSKLNKSIKLDKLEKFTEDYGKQHNLEYDDQNELLILLKDALNKKKLQRVKEIIYDKNECYIKNIPILQHDKNSNRFSLRQHKKTTTTMNLAPKKNTTQKKIKRKEKCSPKHTVKVKPSPKGLFTQKNVKLSSKEKTNHKSKTKHHVSPKNHQI